MTNPLVEALTARGVPSSPDMPFEDLAMRYLEYDCDTAMPLRLVCLRYIRDNTRSYNRRWLAEEMIGALEEYVDAAERCRVHNLAVQEEE